MWDFVAEALFFGLLAAGLFVHRAGLKAMEEDWEAR